MQRLFKTLLVSHQNAENHIQIEKDYWNITVNFTDFYYVSTYAYFTR